ncbi:MAG: tripartite tricarboxylate transporter substrate binding protein [Burkholderiales bacterium]|nr:tripartite tricarboxylate transporter substrate binding protein [Burkholderiales bacterium]
MNNMGRQRTLAAVVPAAGAVLLAAGLLLIQGLALAQSTYPTRAIRFIVPFPPGGATDVVTRVVAQKMNEQYKRQVAVVDNRGGAGGVLGSELAARAAADGYTLVMGTTGTHAINASLYPKLSYDPVKDFIAITPSALLPNMLVAHPSIPVKNVRELIALAKARPGDLSYASSGNFLYLSGALFTSMAKVKMLHVPFKGGAQAMPAVVAGEVGLSFATIVSSLPLVEANKLRGLAVTSAKRFPSAKTYPTVAESGLPGYEAVAWYGVFTPAGTPREIVQQLNTDIVRIVNSSEVRELFLKQGAESYATSPDEFAKVVQGDVAKWARVVKESGAKAD